MKNRRGKVFLVGIDGADWHLVRALIQAGHLPAFAAIAREGFLGRLESTMPPVSAMAWPSIYTGRGPEAHGIWTFFNRVGDEFRWRPATSGQLKVAPLWDILIARGLSSAVMHVPVTYPPRPLRGLMVSDSLLSPEGRVVSYPPQLYEELQARCPGYSVVFHAPDEVGYMEALRRFFEARKAGCMYVARHYPCDLYFYVLNCIDWTAHRYPLTADSVCQVEDDHPLIAAYRLADGFLQDLMALMDDGDSLLVVSDHGTIPTSHIFMVNEWLALNGYLRLKPGLRTAAKVAVAWAWRWLPFRQTIFSAARRARSRRRQHTTEGDAVRTISGQVLTMDAVDETRSLATGYGPLSWYQLSLTRAQAGGPAVEEMVSALNAVQTPSGEPFVKRVWRTEELYADNAGRLPPGAPELIVEPADWQFAWANTIAGGALGTWLEPMSLLRGNHSMDGIIMGIGDAFQSAPNVDARVWDVTPTVLSLFDVEPPARMRGRCVDGIVRAR